MILENTTLVNIEGGIRISGTLLNSLAKLLTTIFDLGRSVGTSINMAKTGRKC